MVTQGAATSPSYAYRLAMQEYDEQFNMDIIVQFYNSAGIIQSQLLTGKALGGTNGVEVIAQAAEQGAPIKIYQVAQAATDYVMIAKNDIQSLEDLEGRQVGIEGQYENAWVFTVLPMQQAGADPDQVNFRVIGFSSSRTQATLSGSVDATPLHIDQARRVLAERDDYHILATINDLLPNYTQTVWVTTDDLIQNRRQDLVNSVKAGLTANRELNNNFEVFEGLAGEYEYEIPEVMSARELYDFYVDAGLWLNNGGMTQDRFEFLWDLLENQLQLVDDMPPIEDVVDFSIAEDALADIGQA
jgi:ABC-type nitrate/sulfonate/bicarbonate transport system substrate-binding protein